MQGSKHHADRPRESFYGGNQFAMRLQSAAQAAIISTSSSNGGHTFCQIATKAINRDQITRNYVGNDL